MKREIKFRAWDGKKMYLPEYSDKEDFHLMADGTIVETHEYGYERHELTNSRGDNWLVMQFTGLKDKNGKDIYEGDVVEHGIVGEKSIVKFKNGSFYLEFQSDVCLRHYAMIVCNVIGNIFENPELLNS